MRAVAEPLPAEDLWTCFYWPQSHEPGWSWQLEQAARVVWTLIKAARP